MWVYVENSDIKDVSQCEIGPVLVSRYLAEWWPQIIMPVAIPCTFINRPQKASYSHSECWWTLVNTDTARGSGFQHLNRRQGMDVILIYGLRV